MVQGLHEGTVDIVIGTHRLLNPDIKMKNLGLIIVDEEQRFGVEHKEQMKRARTSVDVLAMSATPIPRTLEMAITGIREMSTITTLPEERHPVLTYVGAYEDRQVTAAIRRELLREGQVFYIHNRVQSIEKAAAHLREPGARGPDRHQHGQMGEHQLEEVKPWSTSGRSASTCSCAPRSWSRASTSPTPTPWSSSAPTPSACPTCTVLARPGRPGRERAYAYFLYPADKPLTETAHERLGHPGPALRPGAAWRSR